MGTGVAANGARPAVWPTCELRTASEPLSERSRPVDTSKPFVPNPFVARAVAALDRPAIEREAARWVQAGDLEALHAFAAAVPTHDGIEVAQVLVDAIDEAANDKTARHLAVLALEMTPATRLLLRRVGSRGAAMLASAVGLDDAHLSAETSPRAGGPRLIPQHRREIVRGVLRSIIANPSPTPADRAFAYQFLLTTTLRSGLRAEALLAVGHVEHPGDADAARAAAQHLGALYATPGGAALLENPRVGAPKKLEALLLLRADPTIRDEIMASPEGADPWASPKLVRAFARIELERHHSARASVPARLAGTDLENTIGTALGLSPAVPKDADGALERMADGAWSAFGEEPAASRVGAVADAIRAAGGTTPVVSVVPVVYSSELRGPQVVPLFRVEGAEGAVYVGGGGATYRSFEHWKATNDLPPGVVAFGGAIDPTVLNSPNTVDTTTERALEILDTVAYGAGMVAGGMLLIGSGGTAALAVATVTGIYSASRAGAELVERADHRLTIDPFESAAARGAWIEVAAGALSVGSVKSAVIAKRMLEQGVRYAGAANAAARLLAVGATFVDAAAAAEAGRTLVEHWDALPPAQKIALALQLGFWGVQSGAQAAQALRNRRFDHAANRREVLEAHGRDVAESRSRRIVSGAVPLMDFRGDGLVDPSSVRFEAVAVALEQRHGAKVVFDEQMGLGRIDETTGTIHLNPDEATWTAFAHEISHVRFAAKMGRWKTGSRLTRFEENLMEAIGYWGTYRKAIDSGMTHAAAMMEMPLARTFAQAAISGIHSGSPGVMASYRRAVEMYGNDYVEAALRFAGDGLKTRKEVPRCFIS